MPALVQAASMQAAEGAALPIYLPIVSTAPPGLPDRPGFAGTIFGVEVPKISSQSGFQQVVESGASFTRLNGLRWADVEPVEGERQWSAAADIEQQLRTAAEHGIRVVLVVRQTPDWAQKVAGASCGPIRADKFAAFASFMFDLVARYSAAPYYVRYWEIYNEPDIEAEAGTRIGGSANPIGCWGEQDDPYYGGGYYADLLKVIYPRIKQADPEAQVLFGGLLLACNPETGGCWSDHASLASKFFEGALQNGAGAYFDGVSFHSYDYFHAGAEYGYSNMNWNSYWNTTGPTLIAKARFLRDLMAAYQVSGKYLMNTETALLCGSATDLPGSPGCEEDSASPYERNKAYYVVQSYAAALGEGLAANIWYNLKGWRNSGLLYSDHSPRPAYVALKFARATLGDVTFVGPLEDQDIGGARNVTGYKFRRPDGRQLWTIWSQDGEAQQVSLASPPQAVWDSLGNPVTASDPQAFEVSVEPLYLEWPGD
jgi:hypothetical protein